MTRNTFLLLFLALAHSDNLHFDLELNSHSQLFCCWFFILCYRSWLLVGSSFFLLWPLCLRSELCVCVVRFESFSECLMNLLKNVLISFLVIFFSYSSLKIVAIVVSAAAIVIFVFIAIVIILSPFSHSFLNRTRYVFFLHHLPSKPFKFEFEWENKVL